MEQKSLARWVKTAIVLVGVFGLFVYAVALPLFGQSVVLQAPEMAYRYWPWLIFLWVTALPCFGVLVLGWRIAQNIGRDRSFSLENARYLKLAAYFAAFDSALFFLGNVAYLFLNLSHPGVVLASLVVTLAGVAVSVAAAALSRLVQKAARLQEQSDLTI